MNAPLNALAARGLNNVPSAHRLKHVLVASLTCLFCILLNWQPPSAIAHGTDQSYLYFQIGESTITARLELPIKNLNQVLDLGFEPDKRIGADKVDPLIDQIRAYADGKTQVDCAPQSCELIPTDHGYLNTHQSQFLLLNYELTGFDTLPESLQVTHDSLMVEQPDNINMVLIDQNWRTGTFAEESNIIFVLEEPGQMRSLDLTQGGLIQGFVGVVKLAMNHILEGTDHILFLFAMLLPSVLRRPDGSKWQPVGTFSAAFWSMVKMATAFTVGHIITISLSSIGIVSLPGRLVESVIAASIGLVALEIFFPIFRQRLWIVLFVFGLFHGFGFAEILGERGVTSQNALLSLFGFNLGIEIGQLIIIALVFPVLYLLRRQWFYAGWMLRISGLFLAAVSLYWFIERAFAINLQVLSKLPGFG